MTTEQFSNFARTTLASAIGADDVSITVSDATYFPQTPPFRISADKEVMWVTALAGNVFTVTRGYENSTPAAHNSGAVVLHGITAALAALFDAAASPQAGRDTTGDTSLELSDFETSLVSQDSAPVNLFLPAGLPRGFKARSYQGGSGQITYVPINGAVVLDGALRSLGNYSQGYYVDIENVGNDQWLVLGNTTAGLLSWNIIGQQSVSEGDSASFVIWRPDITNSFPNGVSLKVDGTGFASAGFSYNLVQTLTNLTLLDPAITFDGVDTLTILPTARNPIALSFFAVPTYTNVGNRNITITISNPSAGVLGVASITTTINNVSKPTTPDLLFPPVSQNTSAVAAGSQDQITLASVAGLTNLMTASGSASIPGQTWITNITGNVVTLSGNLTGSISSGTALSFKPPGIWFDCSTSSQMTFGSGSKVSALADKLNGYSVTQSVSGNQPSYNSSALNSLGGLTFNSGASTLMKSTTAAPIINLLDAKAQKYTVIMVSKITNASTGGYFGWDGRGSISSNSGNGAFPGMQSVQAAIANGNPYIWQLINDGSFFMSRCNGQRIIVPCTVTADVASGATVIPVDDTTGIVGGMYAVQTHSAAINTTQPNDECFNFFTHPSGITSNQITLASALHLVGPIAAGTPIGFYDLNQGSSGVQSPPVTSTQFILGATGGGTFSGNFVLYELIIVPRVLSPQEWRGITLYLSNKWGTSTTQTVSGTPSSGATQITLNSTTGIHPYMTMSGTGIATGSTVVKANTTTGVITLDTPTTGALTNGQTLTFNDCSFKQPQLLDVSQFVPTYFDKFATGPDFVNLGPIGNRGWQPYYGDPNNPGTFNSSYGAAGHGSWNGGLVWNLDVLNWIPWRTYNPYSNDSPPDAATGEVVITTRPTPPAIQSQVGYNPPNYDPTKYSYIGGYMKNSGFTQQYGFYEARMKVDPVIGAWPAWWMTAMDQLWPPEIDIIEAFMASPGTQTITTHSSRTFNSTFDDGFNAQPSDISIDFSAKYALFGIEIKPTGLDFYLNREKIASCGIPWDFHLPWMMQFDLDMNNSDGLPDNVTPVNMYIDSCQVWKRAPQNPTIPTGTQAETTALLAAMNVQPNQANQNAINTCIASLKTYTTSFGQPLWNAVDFLYLTAFQDSQASRINWKNPSIVASIVGSPTYTTNRGWSGVAGTSYLDAGFNLAGASGFQITDTLNHIGAVASNITNSTSVALGTSCYSLRPNSASTVSFNPLYDSTNGLFTVPTLSTGGHYVCTRNQSHFTTCLNGQIVSVSADGNNATAGSDSSDILIANGSSLISCVHGGGYLSPDDIGYLYQLIHNFLHAIGAQ